MKITNLYRYHGEGGTVDTLVLLPMEHEDMYRLEAEEGKMLTNGEITETVIDIPKADLERWSEIDAPIESEEGDAE